MYFDVLLRDDGAQERPGVLIHDAADIRCKGEMG